jgi:Flp pilus assembly protein TadD
MVVAVLLLGVLVTAGVLALGNASDQGPMPGAATVDGLTLEEMERLAAERPDDVALLLALGHRHFDRSDYDLALAEYLRVLEAEPGHVRAMARSGWIAFEGGDSELAERLVAEALALAPKDPEALWFLAHIRMYGLDRPADAVDALRVLAARDDLTDGFRAQVDQLLAEARG